MIAGAPVPGECLQKMSEAMDGRREAHMDVLVAVFWRHFPDKAADWHPSKRKTTC